MLSCQRLFVGYHDARNQMAYAGSSQSCSDEDWWSGEPPLAMEAQGVSQLFTELKEEIEQADVLVLEDREWMQDEDFSIQLKQLLDQFRAHGGEVRYSTRNSKTNTEEAN